MSDFAAVECSVRQLHARYADAVWRKDYDAFGDCFTDNAEWRMAGNIYRGRSEIVGHLRSLESMFRRIFMTFRTPIVDIENGAVTSRTYISENNVFVGSRSGTLVGIYFDRFVGQGQELKFSWRLFQMHYFGPPDMTGPLFENPDFGPPPRMPPVDALTSGYRIT